MYAALIKALGDEPSAEGYYADQMAGRLGERARRWVTFFAARPRGEWVTILRDAGVACEPVLGPGRSSPTRTWRRPGWPSGTTRR